MGIGVVVRIVDKGIVGNGGCSGDRGNWALWIRGPRGQGLLSGLWIKGQWGLGCTVGLWIW